MNGNITLPPWLKASASTDLLHLAANIRPAIRTELAIPVSHDVVRRWMRRPGWYTAIDRDKFIIVSSSSALARKVLTLDREQSPHTFRLGRALGYPVCCCRAAASVGEQNLDSWARALCQRDFIGQFQAINPSNYRNGKALISHIPCSIFCQASLHMAQAALAALRRDNRPLSILRYRLSKDFKFRRR